MSGLAGNKRVAQVGIIVKDIETTKIKWAEFLGVEVPKTEDIGDFEIIKTEYKGEPAPYAKCKLAFLNAENIQIELIQPNEHPSVWKDYLDEHGEGIHHLAFQMTSEDGTDKTVQRIVDFGMPLIQEGIYCSETGKYRYMDAEDSLKCYVELLEEF